MACVCSLGHSAVATQAAKLRRHKAITDQERKLHLMLFGEYGRVTLPDAVWYELVFRVSFSDLSDPTDLLRVLLVACQDLKIVAEGGGAALRSRMVIQTSSVHTKDGSEAVV